MRCAERFWARPLWRRSWRGGCWPQRPGPPAQNVIVLIGDGAGFNSFRALAMYEGKWNAATGKPDYVYAGRDWIATAATTYPLSTASKATGARRQDAQLVYSPTEAWRRNARSHQRRPRASRATSG